MSTQQQIIERIVLLNVKPDVDLDKVAAMIDALNSLVSLDLATDVSAGELLRSRSSSLTFTHILHCRFRSNDDLQALGNHPEHMRVATHLVHPIIDDIMVVDWVSNNITGDPPKPGSAMRVTLLKLKDDLVESEKNKYFEMMGGRIRNQLFKAATEEISFGANFSDAMAKGYSVCSFVVFPGHADLEALHLDAEVDKLIKDQKVKDSVVVDYVIPVLKVAQE